MCKCFGFIIGFFIASSAVHAGPIYVYREGGAVKFSNKKPPAGYKAKVFTPSKSKFSIYRGRGYSNYRVRSGALYKSAYSDSISVAARKYSIAPELIRAVIHAESSFNPRAVSPKGARGLMQLMHSTQREVGVQDVFSPSENINGGVKYLSMLLRRFKGNLRLALAAYNAGPGAVEKYGGIPPYQETRQYVDKVIHLASRYKSAM